MPRRGADNPEDETGDQDASSAPRRSSRATRPSQRQLDHEEHLRADDEFVQNSHTPGRTRNVRQEMSSSLSELPATREDGEPSSSRRILQRQRRRQVREEDETPSFQELLDRQVQREQHQIDDEEDEMSSFQQLVEGARPRQCAVNVDEEPRSSRVSLPSNRKPAKKAVRRHKKPNNDGDTGNKPQDDGPIFEGRALGEAIITTLSLASKGHVKEAEVKPLLRANRIFDWEAGLKEINKKFADAFGIALVHDAESQLFFVRNDLIHIRQQLNEMFIDGAFNNVRIDGGSTANNANSEEDDFNEDDKYGLLFAILTSMMMSNNVALDQKNWVVEEDTLMNMCVEHMKISQSNFKKVLSGHNAEFIQEKWIRKMVEINGNHDEVVRYTWGPRAIASVRTLIVFQKYCLFHQKPEHAFPHYREILGNLDRENGFTD